MSDTNAHWDYRLVKRTFLYPDGETEDVFGIHVCHYSPLGYGENPTIVEAESPTMVRQHLEWMMQALDKDIITVVTPIEAFPDHSR